MNVNDVTCVEGLVTRLDVFAAFSFYFRRLDSISFPVSKSKSVHGERFAAREVNCIYGSFPSPPVMTSASRENAFLWNCLLTLYAPDACSEAGTMNGVG